VSGTALLVVDMLNPYQHRDADLLTASVGKMVEPLADLISRAHRGDGVELIYVNDNHGDFTASRHDIVQRALDGERGDLVAPIVPSDECVFLTKVRHSVFYSTALDYLLSRLAVRQVILTGQVTEQCILYSALDAYVRHYSIRVAPDAVAHIDPDLGAAALRMMEQNMRTELIPARYCLD
jgi:nicotinamidase-related amidase